MSARVFQENLRRTRGQSPGRNTDRLRQLSHEVSRIATTLAQLSLVPEETQAQARVASGSEIPSVALDIVRQVIQARRLRAQFFNEELFADPAWDILLGLLEAEISQRRVSVSALSVAARVPPTTALRWITAMTDSGLLRRCADPYDGRRSFLELSPAASESMRRYFAQVGSTPSI